MFEKFGLAHFFMPIIMLTTTRTIKKTIIKTSFSISPALEYNRFSEIIILPVEVNNY